MNGIDTYSSTSVSQNNGLNMIKLMTGHAETISTVQLNKSWGKNLSLPSFSISATIHRGSYILSDPILFLLMVTFIIPQNMLLILCRD